MGEEYGEVLDLIEIISEQVLKKISSIIKAHKNKSEFVKMSETLRRDLFEKYKERDYCLELDNYLEKICFFEMIAYQTEIMLACSEAFVFSEYYESVCNRFLDDYCKFKPYRNDIYEFVCKYGDSIKEIYIEINDDEAIKGIKTIIHQLAETGNKIIENTETIICQNEELKNDATDLKMVMSKTIKIIEKQYVDNGGMTKEQVFLNKKALVKDKVFQSTISITASIVDECFELFKLSNTNKWEKQELSKPVNKEDVIGLVKKNRLVFIVGGFGTGKTFLSKYIYLKLAEDSGNELYFYYSTVFFSDLELCPIFKPESYVFVDSVDAVAYCKKEPYEIIGYLERVYENNPSCKFIFNMRTSYDNVEDFERNDNNPLAYFALDENDKDNDLYIIKTIGFRKANGINGRDKLDKYLSKIAPDDARAIYESHHLDDMAKHAVETCFIPLFAYILGSAIYKNPSSFSHDRNDALRIYSAFVDETIRGKFNDEMILFNGYTLKYDYFEMLLQRMAVGMIKNRKEEIDYSEDASDASVLDNSTNNASEVHSSQDVKAKEKLIFKQKSCYPMDIDLFDVKLKAEVKKLYEEFGGEQEVSAKNVINNYFFSMYKHDRRVFVRFSDSNVLSYLASGYLFNVLVKSISAEPSSLNYEEVYKQMSSVELQPDMIDFLLAKFDSFYNTKDKRRTLSSEVLKLINERNYMKNMSEDSVKYTLLLYILFLRFNDDAYSYDEQSLHFFKDMQFVINCAKNLNVPKAHKKNDHRFLLERYFIGCSFIGCDFKRINLKHYNFSKTKIKDSTFTQCKFSKNRFDSAIFKQVEFKNCIFIDQAFSEYTLEGNVVFENCQFSDVDFVNANTNYALYFDNCYLDNVRFRDLSRKVEIYESTIKNVSINHCGNFRVYLRENTYLSEGGISGDNSEIMTNEPEHFVSGKARKSKAAIHLEFDDLSSYMLN